MTFTKYNTWCYPEGGIEGNYIQFILKTFKRNPTSRNPKHSLNTQFGDAVSNKKL